MTEVNGTNTTIMFVSWLPFKAEAGKQRESEKGRVNTPMSVFVNRVWTWYTPKVGGGQWMRIVSQSAPDRSVDNVSRWTLRSRAKEKLTYYIYRERPFS